MRTPAFTGKNLIRLPETSSTNTLALELLKDDPPDGTVIMTYFQKSGRGQKGNTWYAQPGKSLTFSVIYYPEFLEASALFDLSRMTSLALYNTMVHFLPMEDIYIKWPNDILINQKKIAGILIENQLMGSRVRSAIIGIGLNVNQDAFLPEIDHLTTSMKMISDGVFDLEKVFQHLLMELENHYIELKTGQKAQQEKRYLDALWGYQEEMDLSIEGQEGQYLIVGVDKSGRLAVKVEDGLRYFDIKEVQFLR